MTLPVSLGVCILPTSRWGDARSTWIDLDTAGVHHLWTYDHLSWRDMRDGPWFGAMPLLSGVAAVTKRAKLGPLVASPNYRHPVTFAKEALTLADVSNERFICAVGAGGTGWDATTLGQPAWSRKERTERFGEFVDTIAELFANENTTRSGAYYSAIDARMIPQLQVPVGIAATGPMGLAIAAKHADWWITFGDALRVAELSDAECLESVRAQINGLEHACSEIQRDPENIRRLLLTGSSQEPWMSSAESFLELAHTYAAIGITDIVLHAPQPVSHLRCDPKVLESILSQL
jgi:alkanesulfonate monooxygenase SsuD/methylene tetrahydromethanopterin reductase-like flavin-dependent oxidoreductase (luciferase family)